MTLQDLESISVIAASWFGICATVVSIFKKSKPETGVNDSTSSSTGKSDRISLLKRLWKYILAIFLFCFAIIRNVTGESSVDKLDVLLISGCVGVIILLLVRMMYIYTLWSVSKYFEKDSAAY
ncbi:hypothetical protein ATY35_19725 [Vibrio cidicii]|uniref:Uncharacterized protein n=2 Tax=Vibrio cidicii TaxID=1763883 RepID=A0ABR5VXK7_9VIBR|nr:hypothetical protein [Vibrio parahaemolyticus]EJE4163712.1 hypothetical protein [Vibrio parahaemolyticus]KYN82198.1 hypothetical protein ATY35_19725 [Vibrio cidicii]TBT26281.1 hypothetical protein D5E86_18715 [Vibrio parahaemolyticus]